MLMFSTIITFDQFNGKKYRNIRREYAWNDVVVSSKLIFVEIFLLKKSLETVEIYHELKLP